MIFLIVYDRKAGIVRHLERFADADFDASGAARLALELEHRKAEHLEIVEIESHDETTLRKTHARYFESAQRLAAALTKSGR